MAFKCVVILFLNLYLIGLCNSFRIWKTIPNIGPQMCNVECKRYNGNCVVTEYDDNNHICNLMEEDESKSTHLMAPSIDDCVSSSWVEKQYAVVKKLMEGCSNTTCHSYYVCDVTSITHKSFCTELDCLVGHYRARNDCIPCPKGQYQSKTGQYHCDQCPVGWYSPQQGSSNCQYCPRGSYQNTGGQSSCILCSEGHYQNNIGQTYCLPCNPGYYAMWQGMTTCNPCPAGTVQPVYGTSGCINCDRGYYQDQNGQTHCKQCGLTQYQDQQGQTYCKHCNTVSSFGATSCILK